MALEQLDATALARFKRDPIAFITHTLRDPETGEPFVLSDAERQFLQHAFTLNDDGKLVYPELVFGAINAWLAKNAPKASPPAITRHISPDPDNADAALPLLGIAAPNPVRADIGADRAQLLLEPLAVQAALRRRRIHFRT